MSDITHILRGIDQGRAHAADELLPLVYRELRLLAQAKLKHEKPGLTLQPTALVHEAFVRLAENDCRDNWRSRGHFFAAAAEAMRRILVESARRKKRIKHGGDKERVQLTDIAAAEVVDGQRLLALDRALQRLAAEEPDKAQLVKLRYFGGLSEQDAAEALGISRATASRHWTYARAWLFHAMQAEKSEPD